MGGESVFKPFVLLFTMIALMVSVIVMVQHTQISATAVASDKDLQNMMGEMDYTLIDPVTGILVNAGMATSTMVHPEDAPIEFTDNSPDGHADVKHIQIIIGNQNYKFGSDNIWEKYPSFISIQRRTTGGIDHKWYGAAIPIQGIIENFDYETNQSIMYFHISGKNDTMIFELADNNTARFWGSDYTMFYGWSTFRTEGVDFWETIQLIYTAKLPGMDGTLSFFIAGMFWAVTLFMLFTMISRIVPFISGG